jgi:hypothetical protein
MSLYTTYIIYVHVYSLYYLCHTAYIIYVSIVTLARKSFSMTSHGSREQKCGDFEVGRARGAGGDLYVMSSFYFMGTHWYRLPADTSLNLNSVTRSIDI